jgi:hypothetical protein
VFILLACVHCGAPVARRLGAFFKFAASVAIVLGVFALCVYVLGGPSVLDDPAMFFGASATGRR